MKKAFLMLFGAFAATASMTQTTAQDFTKTDCLGAEHHLFATLDSGNCVLMEFAMLTTCQPCIIAGGKIEVMKKTVNAAHPGKVQYFVFDFAGAHDCATIINWENSGGMHSTPFQHGETEVDYYGGMGMPTFALVAGPQHKVLWKKIGFTTSDTTTIKNKINAFFQSSGTSEALQSVAFQLSPNPAQGQMTVSLDNPAADVQSVEVFDAAGNLVLNQKWSPGVANSLDVSALAGGTFFLQILDREGAQVGAKRFVKE